MAAARNPFTSGDSTCCDIRSAVHRPVRAIVATGKKTMLPTHPVKASSVMTSGALTTRHWIAAGAGTPAGGGTQRAIGQRYATASGVSTPYATRRHQGSRARSWRRASCA